MNRDLLTKWFIPKPARPPDPVPAGLYHYMLEQDATQTRLHLRVEPDGTGMLIANATGAARLSPSGVVIAKGLLEGDDETKILKDLQNRFHTTTTDQVQSDIAHVRQLLQNISSPGDQYPIFNLEDAEFSLHESQLMAPLEADVPLAPPEKLKPILDRIWAVGIPHVTILVPENPDHEHLVRAVEHAETLGLICGVSGRGSDLAAGKLLDVLAIMGVDHVTVYYASADPEIHDALFGAGDHAAVAEVFTRTQALEVADVGHVPLVQATIDDLDETLEALRSLEVPNAAFFAVATTGDDPDGAIPAEAMRQVAAQVEEDANEASVRYIWEPPVERDLSISLTEQVRAGPRCSGDVAVRIETTGSVFPPRGPMRMAGDILRDDWSDIWRAEAFRVYRERVEAPTRCEVCPGLAICAADCPQDERGWARGG